MSLVFISHMHSFFIWKFKTVLNKFRGLKLKSSVDPQLFSIYYVT